MKHLLPILALLAAVVPVCAQGPTVLPVQAPSIQVPPGTLTIDGSTNPQAIPDAVALRLFYAMSHPQNGKSSGEATTKSLEVFLQKLAPPDVALLRKHIADWGSKYGPQLVGSAPGSPVATYEQISAAAEAELLLLRTSLSPFGWSTFEAELTRRKATMKIYQVPASAMQHK